MTAPRAPARYGALLAFAALAPACTPARRPELAAEAAARATVAAAAVVLDDANRRHLSAVRAGMIACQDACPGAPCRDRCVDDGLVSSQARTERLVRAGVVQRLAARALDTLADCRKARDRACEASALGQANAAVRELATLLPDEAP